MNYLKYFKNDRYELGKLDCWTFTQYVFKEEQGINLPDVPVFDDPENESRLKANIKHKQLDKAEKGCLVYVPTKMFGHTGYAISEKEYMHKTAKTGVQISLIPKTAEFFKIL